MNPAACHVMAPVPKAALLPKLTPPVPSILHPLVKLFATPRVVPHWPYVVSGPVPVMGTLMTFAPWAVPALLKVAAPARCKEPEVPLARVM